MLSNATIRLSSAVNDLGFQLDSQATTANQVAAFTQCCFLLSLTLAMTNQTISDNGSDENTGTRFYQLLLGLL